MGALGALHRMDGCFGGQSPPRVHPASGIRHLQPGWIHPLKRLLRDFTWKFRFTDNNNLNMIKSNKLLHNLVKLKSNSYKCLHQFQL